MPRRTGHNRILAQRGLQCVGNLHALDRRRYGHRGESYILRPIPAPVAVTVVDCENIICPRLEVADGELPVLIRFSHTLKGQRPHSSVRQVTVNPYYHTLGGFEVACLENHT